ncbi:MAG: hypothetical protein P4L22_04000 [Candidatus Babeliales bacterium]|nr:hypothetical protein [Candidatus Babeliales bacterium]
MRNLWFLVLISICSNVFSCPTKLAYELLEQESISFRDVNTSMGD